MNAMMGWSGTCSLLWLIVTFSPAGIFTLPAIEVSSKLGERVERRACLEPADLLVGQGVVARDGDGLAARLVNDHLHRLARHQRGEPAHAHAIGLLEEVVVLGIAEGQGQDALLLKIGLVDAREAPDDDDLGA